MWTGSAMADPDNPATSDEAQQAYSDSSHRAGALNEEVLVAQENGGGRRRLPPPPPASRSARPPRPPRPPSSRPQQADQAAASYQGKVDAFANASFRGARLARCRCC